MHLAFVRMEDERTGSWRRFTGVAVTGSVFYTQLAASHGNFASAFRHGILSIAAFGAAAPVLVLAGAFTRDS